MQKNYNENLVAGAAIRDDKGRRISKLFEASHPKMTVGYAKNLIMPDTPTEQEFNFRQAGGGVIEDGVAVIDKVKGNSVVWNQLRKNYRAGTNFGVVSTQIGNSVTIKGTADSTLEYNQLLISDGVEIKRDGTKYLYLLNKSLGASWGISGYGDKYPADQLYGFFSTNEGTNWSGNVFRQTNEGDVIDIEGLIIQLIDLTQMFGAGNEPSTVEEFLSRKPKVADEYAYNEGTIVNNKVEKVATTGRNLWDEEWKSGYYLLNNGEYHAADGGQMCSVNPIRVEGGKTYYYLNSTWNNKRLIFYDANMAYIGYIEENGVGEFTMPTNAAFMHFYWVSTTYNHDICINLSDPTINGQYFPYEKHELDLSWVKDIKDGEGVKLFEDGMKSAGTAFDEVAKGRAIKRIGVKVFDGTENWRMIASAIGFNIGIPNALRYNVLVVGYTYRAGSWELEDMEYSVNDYFIGFKNDKYADIESWKAHLADLYAAGTPLVVYYELAEPIEVEYDEKNLTYPVVAGSTEEAIASEPSSAFRADIGYGIDAVKTILDLKARVEALEGK